MTNIILKIGAGLVRRNGHEMIVTLVPCVFDFKVWVFVGTLICLITLYIVEKDKDKEA